LTTGDDDGVRATCDEASDDGRDAATSGGDAGDDPVLVPAEIVLSDFYKLTV
jgi:hypothetical protein